MKKPCSLPGIAGSRESIPVKILIEPKIFTMKDKGQFNELYDYECWNCRERCFFQGEEHPANVFFAIM
jgi:hypothetical protein